MAHCCLLKIFSRKNDIEQVPADRRAAGPGTVSSSKSVLTILFWVTAEVRAPGFL